MAIRIPRISPRERTITSQTPGRTIDRVGIAGELTKEAGRAIADIGENIKRANLSAERTRAQNQFDSTLFDIQSRASKDVDLSEKKQRSYDEEIRKAGSDASGLISIPSEKSRFELESRSKSEVSRIKVGGFFDKKRIEQGKIDLDNYLANKEVEFVSAGSIAEKQTALLERNNKINEAAQVGYLTKKEASDQIKKLNKDWDERQLDHDISVNPALARENIVAGNYDLTAKEEKTALTLANDLEKKRNLEEKRVLEANMQNTEIELYNGVLDGSRSLKDINDLEARGRIGIPGGIREGVAADLRRLVTKGNTATLEEKADSFVALQDRFTDLNFKEEISLDELAIFRNDVISAMAKGQVRETVGEKWLKDTSDVLDKELRAEVEKKNPRSGWRAIKFWVDGLDPEEKQAMKEKLGQELMRRVEAGEEETKAANEIIEEETKDFNPNKTLYELGQTVNTARGLEKIVGFDTDGEPLVELVK